MRTGVEIGEVLVRRYNEGRSNVRSDRVVVVMIENLRIVTRSECWGTQRWVLSTVHDDPDGLGFFRTKMKYEVQELSGYWCRKLPIDKRTRLRRYDFVLPDGCYLYFHYAGCAKRTTRDAYDSIANPNISFWRKI